MRHHRQADPHISDCRTIWGLDSKYFCAWRLGNVACHDLGNGPFGDKMVIDESFVAYVQDKQ